jgi:hypothetical protein
MICPSRLRVFDGPAFACDAGTPEVAGIVRASLQGDVEKLRPWTPHATEAMNPQVLERAVEILLLRDGGRGGAILSFSAPCGGLEAGTGGVRRRVVGGP